MRILVTAFGRILVDLYLLEPEEQPADDDEPPDRYVTLAALVEICTDDPPFGFRPGPWPWPPSWE